MTEPLDATPSPDAEPARAKLLPLSPTEPADAKPSPDPEPADARPSPDPEPVDVRPALDGDEPSVFQSVARPAPDRLKRWGKTALTIALLVAIGILPGYIVIVNVMLSTKLISRMVSHDEETVSLTYDSAWSVWPGVVHVKGFEVRGSDSVLQWVVQLDEVSCDIHLWELLNRKFYARDIHAKGFVFRVRLRVEPTDADDPLHDALPSIPGYTNPPLVHAGPPELLTDENYNLWTAHLDDIDTTVREVWIQHYRLLGEGRLRGGFFFKPVRVVQVDPALLEMESGEVHLADHVVARLSGFVQTTIDPFDPRGVDGLNILETISARIALDAQLPGLDFINFHTDPSSGVRVEDGSGALRTDLTLRGGTVSPGSFLSLATAHLGVSTPDLEVDASGEVVLRVTEGDDEAGAHLAVTVPRATLARPGKGLPPAAVEGLHVALRSDELGLIHLPSRFAAKVNVPAAVLPDLRWFNREGADPAAPELTGGIAFFRGKAEIDEDGRGTGALRALVRHAAVRFKQTSIQADAVAELALESSGPLPKLPSIRKSKVEVSDVIFKHKGEAYPAWWAKVDIEEATLGEDLIHARLKLRCKDAQPAVGLLDAEDVIPGWAAGLLTLEGLTASADVRKSDAATDFKLLKAEGGSFELRGRLKKPVKGKPEGAFLVSAGPLSVGISIDKDGTGVTPLAGDVWVNKKMAALDR